MVTAFDWITVICFAGLVVSFLQFADQQIRTLLHCGLAGTVFAVANQVGNADAAILGTTLITAGIGYAAIVLRS